MGGTYNDLTLFEDDPDSRFLNLYNRFSSQYPDIGNFLEQDDPDLLAYQKMASEPTGSEEMIRSYIGRVPTREQYNPSFKQKMMATLIGSLAGDPLGSFATARKEIQRPYSEAVDEWKMEGSNIGARARLMDAERQRQLQAMRFGLQTKTSAARNEYTQKARGMAESRRIAAEIAGEEERKNKELERQMQQDFMNDLRTSNRDITKLSQENLEAQRAFQNSIALENARRADERLAEKKADIDRINKQLEAHASQRGIPSKVGTINLTAQDLAKKLAWQDASKYEWFKSIMGPKFKIIEGMDKAKEDQLRKYLESRQAKYLRGEF